MHKYMRKALMLILVLSVALSFLTGCGKQETAKQEAQGTENDSGKEAGAEGQKEKMKVTWAAWVPGPVDNNSYAEQELEKEFPDIDIEFWAFERATWIDQINTRVAGGDIPDIIYRDDQSKVADYVKQGILAEVSFDLIKKDAPNIYKASMDYGSEVWLACNADGKNYGIPIMQPSQTRPFTNAWREDWLDKVGITKIPETIDEFEEAFKKFVNEDPDGNGQKDTYGMTFRGKDSTNFLFSETMTAFGAVPGQWMLQSDGTVKWGVTTSGAKEALTVLNKWYAEGLIDPEFITTDAAIYKQKLANGKIGYMTWGTWYRFIPGSEYYEALKAVNPNAEVAMGPAPKGPQGKYGYMNWGTITSSETFGKQLASQPEKLERVLQIVDRCCSDEDLYAKLYYGKEGEHWERNAENNGVEPIPPYNDVQKTGPIGKNFFASLSAIPEVQAFYARKDEPELYKYAVEGNVKNNQDYFTWISLFTNPDITKQTQNADTVAAKWVIDFITGAQPIDKFDQFVKEWEEAGGAQRTEDANNAYKNGKAEIDKIKDAVS